MKLRSSTATFLGMVIHSITALASGGSHPRLPQPPVDDRPSTPPTSPEYQGPRWALSETEATFAYTNELPPSTEITFNRDVIFNPNQSRLSLPDVGYLYQPFDRISTRVGCTLTTESSSEAQKVPVGTKFRITRVDTVSFDQAVRGYALKLVNFVENIRQLEVLSCRLYQTSDAGIERCAREHGLNSPALSAPSLVLEPTDTTKFASPITLSCLAFYIGDEGSDVLPSSPATAGSGRPVEQIYPWQMRRDYTYCKGTSRCSGFDRNILPITENRYWEGFSLTLPYRAIEEGTGNAVTFNFLTDKFPH